MARFAVADLEDQSAPVWIVTLLSLSYTTMTALMRGFIKLSMLGIDDGGASLAQLLTYGNIFSIIYALRHGLARSGHRDRDDNEEPDYREALQASIILYLLALATAKVTNVLFLIRVFRKADCIHAMLLCKVALVALSLWGIGAAVIVSAKCGPENLWHLQGDATCNGDTRWLIVTILDGVTEVGMFIIAVWLVSRLQMTVKKKFGVCVAFAWRLVLVAMAVFHYRSYYHVLHSVNTNVAISNFVIWEQVNICYSLLSITWPFSKVFINSFDTAPLVAPSAYGSGAVASSTAAAKSRSQADPAKLNTKRLWQDNSLHSSAICSRPTGLRKDNESFGSQEMIIRRYDEVIVSYDDDHVVVKGQRPDPGKYC